MAEELPNSGQLKQRFKGIENFLRRVAFNLGNSPSQTEVKIISCIPIDVTDLQQKICDLERVVTRIHKPPAIVHTALCGPALCESELPGLQEIPACDNILNDVKSLNEQKSLSFKDSHVDVPDQTPRDLDQKAVEEHIGQTPSSSVVTFSNENCDKNNKKPFFKKSRKKSESQKKRNIKQKSHMVYYAHTDNSPFKIRNQNKRIANVVDKKMEKNDMKKDTKVPRHLTDLLCRQYESITHQYSGISDFSSPICRDVEYSCLKPNRSDICSCCHMDFHNIDKDRVNNYGFTKPTFQDQINSQNMYYDSSLYDLVPVKEAPVKAKKSLEQPKIKKHYRNEIDFSNYMSYNADRPYDRPTFVNYHTILPTPRVLAQSKPKKIPANKTYKRKPLNRRTYLYNERPDSIQVDTSNSCCVECGNVYKKTINKKPEPPKKIQLKNNTVTYNDAVTSTFNNSECQTVTTIQTAENESILSDDKTEETLNQIKSILQSVLTEVKTNSILKTHVQEKVKKDAVVQKGTSFGNMAGSSRLLNSFSYGAYNTGLYGASCSHPINSGEHWPYSPKYLHNYPVFIQTPGRLPYSHYYRNNSHVVKPSHHTPPAHRPARKATSAATNTDERSQSHETEALIKEIYKSIALNIDVPKKDMSTSNCSSVYKRSSRNSTKCSYKTDKNINARQAYTVSPPVYGKQGANTAALSQFSTNTLSSKKREEPLPPFSSNTISNRMTSNNVSAKSHAVCSTDTDRPMRNKLRHYLDTTEETPSEEITSKRVIQAERRPATETTVTANSSDAESDESEHTLCISDAKTEIQKKQRTGLFSKMMNSVKLFKNRRKKLSSKMDSEEEESDSDDYQTIYSQQVQQPKKLPIQIHVPARRIPHSKVSYSRQMRGRNQEKLRRVPMEQEYRRQWNEQLMYQQRPRYSTDQSERSYKSSQRYKTYKQPYKQTYMQPYMQPYMEPYMQPCMHPPYMHPYPQPLMPKPVMVEQGIPVQKTMFQDILTTLPKQRPFRRTVPNCSRSRPPRGLSWVKKRVRCGENIVRSLIEDN